MVSMSGSLRRLGLGALAAVIALPFFATANIAIRSLAERASSADRLVLAHYMIGIVGERTSSADYDDDMQRAKAAGIDAFAFNIGVDSYTDQQLGFAFESANRNGMKGIISFDFNWWSTSNAAGVGAKIKQYASQPAQLMIDGRPMASSFAGDGLDVSAMKAAAGVDVYFVPNFHPQLSSSDNIDGALNWMAWDNDGNNKAPKPGHSATVADGDNEYRSWLSGKPYLAPVSPWFSTHYGPEVSYSKNWVFPSNSLYFDRWNTVLQQGFNMVEIITWNDYGECHYVGPLKSRHFDDGNSKWTNDMPHDGFLELSKPFIAAYKNKDKDVSKYIQQDQIIYWYRRNLKTLNCDSTDTTANHPANNASGNYFEGVPDGWQTMDDAVFVSTLLQSPGTVTVSSGGNTVTQNVPAGANLFTVPAGLGKQIFTLSRNGQTVMSETSLMDITDVCSCGLYNFNVFTGTVPAGFSDPLQGEGLASLVAGLRVTTCQPHPSLGTNPSSNPTPPTNSSPTTKAGNTPTTKAGNTPTTKAGNTPTTKAGNTPTTKAGNTPTTKAGNTPTTKAGNTPTTKAGNTPTTKAGNTPTTNPANGTPPVTATPGPGQVCTAGTVAKGESNNYTGLCDFSCHYGYCPPGPCVCTAFGAQVNPPASNGKNGCPLAGENSGYLGLCSFSCNHGYCPEGACQYC